jgi:hypothetical protein
VLDLLFFFEQNRVLFESCDFEIGLKSLEVVLGELAEQKVFHGALSKTGESAKNSQLSVALLDTR